MPNLTAQLEAAVQATWPGATVVERGRNFLRHRIADDAQGRARYVLDASIGSLHYHDGASWQAINTDWIVSSETGFTDAVTAAAFHIHSDGTGRRRIYPRRDAPTEYIEFARPQYWTGTAWANLNVGNRTKTANSISWNRPTFGITAIHSGSILKVSVTLKNSNAARRIRWPVSLVGLTWNNWTLVSQSDGANVAIIPKPVMVGANGVKGAIVASYVSGAVEFTADVTGLTYPITIDPTIDLTVGSNALDAQQEADGEAGDPDNDDYIIMGSPGGGGVKKYLGATWTGVTINSGATITTSYAQWYHPSTSYVDIDVTVYGDDAASPGAYDYDVNDISARTRTTASVAWSATLTNSAYNSTPSLNTIIQELFDSYGPYSSGSLALILVGVGTNWGELSGYLSTSPAKIHIEYTAGGIAANLTGTGSLAAAPTISVPVTLAASGLGGFAAVVNVVTQIASALSGLGSLVADVISSIPVTGTASGTGSLAADVTASSPAAAALSGSGSLTVAATATIPIAAALSGTGSLAADETVSIPAAAVLSGTGTLTIAASASTPIAASLTGAGAQAAEAIVSIPIAASLAGSGALAGDLTVSNPVSANLSGAGSLTVEAIASVPIVADLSGAGALAADVTVTVPIDAALSGTGSLAATAEETISANLSATGSLSASVTVVAAPSAPAAAPAGGGGAVPSLLEFIRKRPAFVKIVYFPAAEADICRISATVGLPEVVIPVSGRASFAIAARAKRAQAITEASGILRCGLPVLVSGRVECVVDAAVLHRALQATAERSQAETEEALLLLLMK